MRTDDDTESGGEDWTTIFGDSSSVWDEEPQGEQEPQTPEDEARIVVKDDPDSAPESTLTPKPVSTPRPTRVLEARPRPVHPLVKHLHIENLKSLAGPHDIPLAPLTLVYGENSAGKSTVLQALRLFARAVTSGRHDALHVFENCFEDMNGFVSLITAHDRRRRLVLGAEFRVGREGYARSAIGFVDVSPAERIEQSSALGAERGHLARKKVTIDYGDFGRDEDEPVFLVASNDDDASRRASRRVRAENGLFAITPDDLEGPLYDIAAHLVDLGPHRGDPQHEYKPDPQPFQPGRRLWDVGDKDLNKALNDLDVPYRFERNSPRAAGRAFGQDRRLVDKRTGIEVGLDQVGYGVSQILPIIEACIRSDGNVICIEQPELHIHPRLQAKLGDLFAESVLRGNQIIAETHSENILLRVRRLIRQGTLKPEDVAVIYVDNGDEGVVIRQLRLGERGGLLDPWPTGFFDDSLDDLFGGWR